jgi:hypothetical protein
MTTTATPQGGYEIPMYNRQGVRISLDEWALLMDKGRTPADPTAGYYRIAYDMINHVLVSTVWRGFDFRIGHGLGGEPLIFETVVTDGCPDHDEVVLRWATEEQARTSHAQMVERVKTVVSATSFLSELARLMGEGDDQ